MSLLTLLAPELALIIGAMGVLLIGLAHAPAARRAAAPLALLTVMVAAVIAWYGYYSNPVTLSGLRWTNLTWYVRMVALGTGILVLLVHWPLNLLSPGSERSDLLAMILFSLSGILLTSMADDLVLLFLSIELVSVPTYVLVSIGRSDIRAQEAGLKYFFLGALSAAVLVYGLSFLYGASGTTVLSQMALSPQAGYATIGLLLSFAGLSYKMAAVPFHVYAADVYQGAASPVTGLLGFFPKVAGLVALVKLLLLTQGASATSAGWNLPNSAFVFLWIISAATMTVGNVLGLMQHNVKRMLAYSSVAHSGYMLIGVLVGPSAAGGPLPDGVSAALFYVAVYGVMNLGAFAVLSLLEAKGQAVEELEDLAGLAKRQPAFALAFTICLFSLMGMPPTGGFFGKIYIFSSPLSASSHPEHGTALVWLAIIGLLNSAVAAGYYLRIIATLYLRDEERPTTIAPYSGGVRVGVVLCSLFVLLVGIWPQALIKLARQSTIDLRPTTPAMVKGEMEDSHRSG